MKEIYKINKWSMLNWMFNQNPLDYMINIISKHDGIVECALPYKFLLTDKPEVIRNVLQKKHDSFTKSHLQKTVGEFMGNGLLFSENEHWKKQRLAIQKGFHGKQIEKIVGTIFDEIEAYMASKISTSAKLQKPLILQEISSELTFRIMMKSLFSKMLTKKDFDFIVIAITEIQKYTVQKVTNPLIDIIPLKKTKIKRYVAKMHAIIKSMITERKSSGEEYGDLLDMLIHATFKDGSKMSTQEIIDEIILFVIAGHETSSNTMLWALVLLAKNPEVKEHICSMLPKKVSIESLDDFNRNEFRYILQVINESMRLYPPVWVIDRRPKSPVDIDGYLINKDILCFIYSLHRHPDYWDSPNKFDPDRFSEKEKEKIIPFSYMPFGAGPRRCIGRNLALVELQLIFALFLNNYDFTIENPDEIKLKPVVSLQASKKIKITFQKRQ